MSSQPGCLSALTWLQRATCTCSAKPPEAVVHAATAMQHSSLAQNRGHPSGHFEFTQLQPGILGQFPHSTKQHAGGHRGQQLAYLGPPCPGGRTWAAERRRCSCLWRCLSHPECWHMSASWRHLRCPLGLRPVSSLQGRCPGVLQVSLGVSTRRTGLFGYLHAGQRMSPVCRRCW